MPRCEKCGVFVSNLRKHKERKRCRLQHIRRKDRHKLSDIPIEYFQKNRIKKEKIKPDESIMETIPLGIGKKEEVKDDDNKETTGV